MFLFVSNADSKQNVFKKTVLSTALLMLSLSVQAESAAQAPEKLLEQRLEQPLDDASSPQVQEADDKTQSHPFPHWPHHMQSSKSIIPPPPPGPYKSSALNDYAVPAPVHMPAPVHRSIKPTSRQQAVHHDAASAPMDMFSPDIPWPTNLRPQQKMPEHRVSNNGQPYAAPQAMTAPPYQPAPYRSLPKPRYGNYNYERQSGFYPAAPGMNSMGMDSSRWMPSMGMAPPGPYNSRGNYNRWNYAPNFSPDYGSNYGPGYNRPVTGNNGMKSTNHPYR